MRLKFKSASLGDGDGRRERIQWVAKQRVIAGNETPLVFSNVVDLTRHVVVASYYVDFVLEEEALVRNAQLIHWVQWLPGFTVHIEQVHFSISVRVLTSNQDNFSGWHRQGTACPQGVLQQLSKESTYFHSNCQNRPSVLFDFVNFDCVVDLLLSAAEETAKRIDEFVIDGARTQVVAFVFHHRHLSPLVLLDDILLDRVESLFAWKSSKNEDVTLAHSNGVRVAGLIHGAFVIDFVLDCEINTSVFLGRRATSSDENFVGRKSNCSRTLVEFAGIAVI